MNPALVSIVQTEKNYKNPEAILAAIRGLIQNLSLSADFIQPGDKIVIKPNWVKEHDERHSGPNHWEHIVSHPVLIEAVATWAAEQLGNKGSITICDAPQTDSSFAKMREYCQLDAMLQHLQRKFPNVVIKILDLRPEEWLAKDGITVSKTKLVGDPLGSVKVELGENSEFYKFHGEGKLFGASVDMEETNTHHSGHKQEYLLCRTPMDADVLICLPKLKTHKKVGLTCALKNLVGINANKNWLPHHTEGTPDQGGDQFPKNTAKAKLEHSWMGCAKRWMKKMPILARFFVPIKGVARVFFGDTQKTVRSGNWYGNDTCWRMVLDLNKCLFYFDSKGERRQKPLRYLAIVDGIIGGDGNGPMSADPIASGVLIAGINPLSVDCAASRVMGFDWRKIRMLCQAFAIKKLKLADFQGSEICYRSTGESQDRSLDSFVPFVCFRPHFGWIGAIELDSNSTRETK